MKLINKLDEEAPLFFMKLLKIETTKDMEIKPITFKINFYQASDFIPYHFYKSISSIL